MGSKSDEEEGYVERLQKQRHVKKKSWKSNINVLIKPYRHTGRGSVEEEQEQQQQTTRSGRPSKRYHIIFDGFIFLDKKLVLSPLTEEEAFSREGERPSRFKRTHEMGARRHFLPYKTGPEEHVLH